MKTPETPFTESNAEALSMCDIKRRVPSSKVSFAFAWAGLGWDALLLSLGPVTRFIPILCPCIRSPSLARILHAKR